MATDTAVASAVAGPPSRTWPAPCWRPALAYGASGEHEGFPGTVSIGTEALTTLLVEYGRSAGRWAGRLLVVNGHGGNLDALRTAVPLLRAEGRDVAWFPCGVPGGDAHAGRTETSLMLHVEPGAVREARPRRGRPRRSRRSAAAAARRGGAGGQPRPACWATRPGRRPRRARSCWPRSRGRLVAAVAAWRVDAAGRLGCGAVQRGPTAQRSASANSGTVLSRAYRMPRAVPMEKALTSISSSSTTARPSCTEGTACHSGFAVISVASTKIGKATVSSASSSDTCSSLTGTKKLSVASSWMAGLVHEAQLAP